MRSAALALLLLTGCPRAAGPDRVLGDYYAHLRAGRIAAAYALTTPEYRARRSLAAFALQVARQPLLDRGERSRAVRTAVVELGDRRPRVRVLIEDGRMSLAEDPLDLYPSDTPEAALRSFARAVRLDQRAHVAALFAPPLRDRVAQEGKLPAPIVDLGLHIERALHEPLGPIVVDGAGASWLIGDARAVGLELGSGGWWISSY